MIMTDYYGAISTSTSDFPGEIQATIIDKSCKRSLKCLYNNEKKSKTSFEQNAPPPLLSARAIIPGIMVWLTLQSLSTLPGVTDFRRKRFDTFRENVSCNLLCHRLVESVELSSKVSSFLSRISHLCRSLSGFSS